MWDEYEQLEDEDEDDDAPEHLNVGYKVVDMLVETFENEHSILRCFPTGDLEPQPFKEGARAKMEKTAAVVRQKHGLDFPGVVLQWNAFLEMAPQSDDVYEYVAQNPLYVPFKEELFGISSADERYAGSAAADQIQQQQDKDAASKLSKEVHAEVWRTRPCMDKRADMSFERMKSGHDGKGNSTLVPYYNEDDCDDQDDCSEGECSSENEDDWCTVRRNGNLSNFGDTLLYRGLPYERKSDPKKDALQSGTIVSVARRRGVLDGALHFKLQNGATVDYVLCKTIMSTSKRNIYKVRKYY